MPETSPDTIDPGTIRPGTVQHLPLNEIDDTALPRDRTCLLDADMAELRQSIFLGGLRMPVEVFPLAAPDGPLRWGLLSGYRRYHAHREMHGDEAAAGLEAPRFGTIAAFIRPRAARAEQLVQMVEENAIRSGLSPWEQGHIAVDAWRRGVFDTLDEAVARLYICASRQKRARLRAAAQVADEFDGILTAPELLNQHQLTRISRAVQAGFGEVMRAALESSARTAPEAQWELILPYLTEAEHPPSQDTPPPRPGRPRRLAAIRKGLIIRRARSPEGWVLHFSGAEATSGLIDELIDDIELRWGR